jgi:putative phage-type endonuclease
MSTQGSPEWLAERVGRVTASRVADVVAKTKSGYGASRANYLAELIAERLTGQAAERYTNGAMQWGTENEPEAREAYEFLTGNSVNQVGFIPHPTIQMSGASPDGMVGEDGLIEIKCPNTSTHIETLLGRAVPSKYVAQMTWQLACTRRKYCDFVSYDPRMPPDMRFFCSRMELDHEYAIELETEVKKFLSELDARLAELTALFRKEAA